MLKLIVDYCFVEQYGGIQVDVATGESFCLITLSQYISGLAPALIVNHLSDYTIEYHQEVTGRFLEGISFYKASNAL